MQVEVLTKEEFQQWADRLVAQLIALIQSPESSTLTTKVYSNAEAALYLKVCKKTLQNYRDDGLIRFTQVGRKITYSHSDLNDFLKTFKKDLFIKQVKAI